MRPIAIFLGIALITQACERAPNAERADEPVVTAVGAAQTGASLTAEQTSGRYRLVILGDSITAGYGLASDQALPRKLDQALDTQGVTAARADGSRAPIDIINAGVSGDTSADALARFDWSVGADADAVLIALGGNDLLQGTNPSVTKANLDQIIAMAKKRGLTVMLAGMRAPGNYGTDYQTAFDRLYSELARKHKVALYPFLLEGVATDPALNQRDGIHPNSAGVAVIVDGLGSFIAASLDERR